MYIITFLSKKQSTGRKRKLTLQCKEKKLVLQCKEEEDDGGRRNFEGFIFLETKEGKCFTCWGRSVPTKTPPILKKQGHIQEKQKAMNQRPWLRQCCLWREKKYHHFSHPARDYANSHPHFNKEKEWGSEKQRRQTSKKK